MPNAEKNITESWPLRLGLVLLLNLSAAGFMAAQFDGGSSVDFQVKIADLAHTDTVRQILPDPETNEVIRLFFNRRTLPEGLPLAGTKYIERGFIREDGRRVILPAEELFFSKNGSNLYTLRNIKAPENVLKQAVLKAYVINRERLVTPQLLDTVPERQAQQQIYELPDRQLFAPGSPCFASSGEHLLRVTPAGPFKWEISLLQLGSRKTILDRKAVYPGKTSGVVPDVWNYAGINQAFVASNFAGLHVAYAADSSSDNIQLLFAAYDNRGILLWERKSVRNACVPQSGSNVFLIEQQKALNQMLLSVSKQSGKINWELPFYELYNNEPAFEFTSVRPEAINIWSMTAVMNDRYIAVCAGYCTQPQQRCKHAMLYLFDGKGEMVYRYALPGEYENLRIKDLGSGFSIFSENKTFNFKPR